VGNGAATGVAFVEYPAVADEAGSLNESLFRRPHAEPLEAFCDAGGLVQEPVALVMNP
jgi:hypothetical protein